MTFLMWNHPMTEIPTSLIAFQRLFPDDNACARWLVAVRWPNGFRCPACGHDRGWELKTRKHSFECIRCHRQTSATAGTLLHRTRLSLATWFWAACLMATHSNGISALQLQKQLGIGNCRSAWMLAAKLRRAMVNPERSPLSGLVEIDEASLPQRDKGAPPGPGRSPEGKIPIAGAVELGDGNTPGRLRLATIRSCSAKDLGSFVVRNTAATATIKTDGWRGCSTVPRDRHQPHVVGDRPAHEVLAWIHTAFSNLKGWARGVCHGLRAKHLQTCLDEFVFRFNRRRNRHAAFLSLFLQALRAKPHPCHILIKPEPNA